MRTTKTHGILFGLGVLGATAALSAFQPVQADPGGFSTIQYRRPYRSIRTYEVITGRVIKNYIGNGFMMITDRGSTYSVTVNRGEPRRLSVGDRVQAGGVYAGGRFRASSFTILRDR